MEALTDRKFTFAKQQRRTINARTTGDLADEQHVVTELMRRPGFTFEPGQRTVNQRNIVLTIVDSNIRKTIGAALQKLFCQTPLMRFKGVDGEIFCGFEYRQTASAPAWACFDPVLQRVEKQPPPPQITRDER